MKKIVYGICSVIMAVFALTLIGCSEVKNDNSAKKMNEAVDNDEMALVSSIPEEISLNGLTYVSDFNFKKDGVKKQELIGYIINRADYERNFKQNPDLMYAINESNSVVNILNDNKISIFSTSDYDVDYCVYVGDSTYFTVYVNADYKE